MWPLLRWVSGQTHLYPIFGSILWKIYNSVMNSQMRVKTEEIENKNIVVFLENMGF